MYRKIYQDLLQEHLAIATALFPNGFMLITDHSCPTFVKQVNQSAGLLTIWRGSIGTVIKNP